MNIKVIVLVSYLLGMLYFGYWCNKKYTSYSDFMVGGRNMPTYLILMTLIATACGGATVFGVTENVYQQGLAFMWYPMGLGVAYLILALTLAKKIRNLAAENDIITVPQFFEYFYKDQRCRIVSALITTLGFSLCVAPQLIGGSIIITYLTGWNPTIATIISAFVVIVYTASGGLWAVVWTDFVQMLLIYVSIIIVAIKSFLTVGGTTGLRMALPAEFLMPFSKAGTLYLLSVLLNAIFNTFVDQASIQRVISAKDEKTAFRSTIGVLFVGSVPLMILLSVIGITGKILYPDIIASDLYVTMVDGFLSPFVGALFLAGLVAAVMSTSDSLLLAATSSVTQDIYRGIKKTEPNEKELKKVGVVATIVIGIISTIIAYIKPPIISIVLLSFTVKASGMFFPFVIQFTKYRKLVNANGAFWSIIVGTIVAMIWSLRGNPYGIPEVLIGVFVSIIVSLTVTRITRERSSEYESE